MTPQPIRSKRPETVANPSAATGGGATASPPGASRFYARNGDVFMVGEQGGFFLSHADEQRMLTLWGASTGDAFTDVCRHELHDELRAAIAEAEAQNNERQAA